MMETEDLCREIGGVLLGAREQEAMTVLLAGLLTPQEAEEIACRWRLMVMLLEGRTQRDISQELGISLGKIARGSRLLKYGPPEFRRLVEKIIREKSD